MSDRAITPPDRLGRVAKTKLFNDCLVIPPQEVADIIDVIKRGRLHLSKGRSAVCAELLRKAENMLGEYVKEKEKENG